MRILHLRASGGVYGAERVVLTLAEAQLRQGLDVHVACLEPTRPGPFAGALRAAGVPAHATPDRSGVDPRGLLRLAQLVRDLRPHVVHSHGYKTDVLAAALAVVPRRPRLVATNHLWTGETGALRAYERIDAVALRAFDLVVAVSSAIRDELVAARVPGARVRVIPNGIAMPARRVRDGRLAAALGLSPATPLVGFVGRLSPQKGLEDLVAAASSPALAHVHFAVAGDGPLRDEIALLARARGVDARLHLLGRRDDVPDLLPELDALVLPSRREGTPLVVLEAMAAGVPPIATRVGGVPDVVHDGETGLLVDPGDVAALTAAVRALVDDPARRRRLGDAAAREVRSRFSAPAMAAAYLEVYEDAGAPRRRVAGGDARRSRRIAEPEGVAAREEG